MVNPRQTPLAAKLHSAVANGRGTQLSADETRQVASLLLAADGEPIGVSLRGQKNLLQDLVRRVRRAQPEHTNDVLWDVFCKELQRAVDKQLATARSVVVGGDGGA